ncbi:MULTISPECIES: DEAD/DEAH box helicase [unclassified Rothia (in: high G+C Gram-positive bacteria)]|uniref:DEAD/DEAH box helicase n=1 Tax=Rothia TaxID=32207 RepID=UPI0008A83044|nr:MULTISPECIES: DEAD/DEAH box helicase [unclassified Rothia (in: high G+C Gram-positive bacteria)]MBF1655476.1 DEAD/DEAH box helicase [Rothia sp. (in: high G+C Gram-positive bacteria)]OHQ17593.1 ATP-dependent helicase [Rothia sp. HMSC065C03]
MTDALSHFSTPVREWFRATFSAPTAAQEGAWESIRNGNNTLIIAPTGSGKTLAAFLWALDALHREHETGTAGGTRILYISPLKALGADVERNLRAPLTGITRLSGNNTGEPNISVGVRSGDTPARERRQLISNPPDILITTPESLYLMLTSAARNTLTGVTTVIVDEIHNLAATKRGAHLTVSLERLDALLEKPAQRIGLSATVENPEAVARFLGGIQPVTIMSRPVAKEWDLRLSVPVPDMAALGGANDYGQGLYAPSEYAPSEVPGGGGSTSAGSAQGAAQPAPSAANTPASAPYTLEDAIGVFPGLENRQETEQADPAQQGDNAAPKNTLTIPEEVLREGALQEGAPREGAPREGAPQEKALRETADSERPETSIWPRVQERIVDHIENNRSTIVFVNSRGLAEKLTAALNDIHLRRVLAKQGIDPEDYAAGICDIAEVPPLARAHHGSVSKEQRTLIEEALKGGTLRCVVATSSLELGIDMGHVDLVIQVAAPPSVASALQRVGRAGHRVGEISRGFFYPKHRGDLLGATVTLAGMRSGTLEPLTIPTNPLDVLAQQTVAACALGPISVDSWYEALRRSAPYAELPRALFDSVLEMLAGRYPSDEFAELRPRIIWDRTPTEEAPSGSIEGRPGAQRLAVTSGGTIPDRGLFPVYLVSGDEERGPKRVGELDEEMVYESRAGEVIILGASSWRIEEITHDAVRVSPAPGQPARLPFWHGDRMGRPYALGVQTGAFTRALSSLDATDSAAARQQLEQLGLDTWAVDNLLAYLREQRESTGAVPSDTRMIVERHRDELGDWRVVLHSPLGYGVHAPWALAVRARIEERYGVDASVMASDDGLILRLPAMEDVPPGADLFLFDPDELEAIVTERVGDSALFASRFRENAARALLLPRRDPGKRTPLWQQRQRAAQLLDVARKYPDFPVLLETARECLQDVYDVPALVQVHRSLQSRAVSMLEVETNDPSPFARTLLFEYVAEHLYDGDAPAAERRAAALSLDPALLAELLGSSGLRDLLDPAVLVQTQQRLQRTGERYRACGVEGVADLLRQLGPLSARELSLRLRAESAAHGSQDFGESEDSENYGEESGEEYGAHASTTEARELAEELVRSRRAFSFMGAADGSTEPQLYYAAVEDAARLRDGLGIMPAAALPAALLESVAEPLEDLVSRYARTHIPFTAQQAAEHFSRLTPVGVGVLTPVLQRLHQQRRLSSGEFLPEVLRALGSAGVEWVDAQVLRTIRARSLAALREEIEPVSAQVYGVFLPSWQNVRSLSVRVAQTLPEASAYGAFIPSRRAATVVGERVAPLGSASFNPTAENGTTHASQDSTSATEDLLTAIDQLAGVRVPASALETLILPARVPGYQPHMLDELMASGRVFFTGAGQLGGGSAQKSDGWIRLHLSESSSLTLGEDYPEQLVRAENPELWEALQTPGTLEHAIYEALAHGGLFVPALRERVTQLMSAAAPAGQVVTFPDAAEVSAALWRLVWSGAVTNDSFAPVRAMLAGVRSAHPTPAAPARLSRVGRRGAGRIAAARASMGNAMAGGYGTDGYSSGSYSAPAAGRGLRSLRGHSLRGGLHAAAPAVAPQDSGRFSRVDTLLQEPVEATVAALARADLLLDRYGVLTRGCLQVEDSAGGFSQLYRIYSAAEDRALVRRGYFIEGLGAAQFAAPATVDLLRSTADNLSVPASPQGFGASAYTPQRTDTEQVYGTFTVTLLAATDPANPYGAALSWPAIPSFAHEGAGTVKHRPARKAGACVVLVDGAPVLYVERGAKTLLAFTTDPVLLEAAAPALARLVSAGGAEKISVEKVNDVELLGTHTLNTSAQGAATGEVTEHPVEALRAALQMQGFYATVRGLSLRRAI